MILDAVVVGLTLTAAAGYLVWHFLPGRRRQAVPGGRGRAPCAACPARAARGGGVPVASRWLR